MLVSTSNDRDWLDPDYFEWRGLFYFVVALVKGIKAPPEQQQEAPLVLLPDAAERLESGGRQTPEGCLAARRSAAELSPRERRLFGMMSDYVLRGLSREGLDV